VDDIDATAGQQRVPRLADGRAFENDKAESYDRIQRPGRDDNQCRDPEFVVDTEYAV